MAHRGIKDKFSASVLTALTFRSSVPAWISHVSLFLKWILKDILTPVLWVHSQFSALWYQSDTIINQMVHWGEKVHVRGEDMIDAANTTESETDGVTLGGAICWPASKDSLLQLPVSLMPAGRWSGQVGPRGAKPKGGAAIMRSEMCSCHTSL